jgi:hypothetical protein
VFDACRQLAVGSLDDDTGIEPLANLLVSGQENRDSVAGMIRQRATDNDLRGMSAVLAVTLDQICAPHGHPDPRKRWYHEAQENIGLVRGALTALAPTNAQAAMELTFCGGMTISELAAAHGPAAVGEAPMIGSTYRRVPIIQQAVIASHDIEWRNWSPHVAVEKDAARG